jgi:hypothetical protein
MPVLITFPKFSETGVTGFYCKSRKPPMREIHIKVSDLG